MDGKLIAMPSSRQWSQKVTRDSHAMDLEPGVFKMTPKRMAKSIKRSVESSENLKSSPFQSGMSMLTFYANRAGKGLPQERVEAIHQAKQEFRKLYKKAQLAELGSVTTWLTKIGLKVPKGSPYTKRFGSNYKNKLVYTAGKIPSQSARGPYTKIASDWREDLSLNELMDMRAQAEDFLKNVGSQLGHLEKDYPGHPSVDKLKSSMRDAQEMYDYANGNLNLPVPAPISGGGAPGSNYSQYLPDLKTLGIGSGAPGLLGAAAGAYEAGPGNRMSGAARGGLSSAVGGAIGTAAGHALGTLTGHPLGGRVGAAAGAALGGGTGYWLGRPKKMTQPKMASLGSVEQWLVKEAPAKSKAQAKFMAVWEKKHGHPEKAKEWFKGTENKPEHVKKKKAESIWPFIIGTGLGLIPPIASGAYAYSQAPQDERRLPLAMLHTMATATGGQAGGLLADIAGAGELGWLGSNLLGQAAGHGLARLSTPHLLKEDMEEPSKKQASLRDIKWPKLGSFSNDMTIGSTKGANPLVEEIKKKLREYAGNVASTFANNKAIKEIMPNWANSDYSFPVKRIPGNLLQGGRSSFQKKAVGTGDDSYENPTQTYGSGSYGSSKHLGKKHVHVQGEADCHLCRGVPLVIMERNDKSQDGGSEKSASSESHHGAEYHEILRIIADALGVDLSSPECVDQLPALLREADKVMADHQNLETAEEEAKEGRL